MTFAVHLVHPCRLVEPIVVAVLDDAQSINPEQTKGKAPEEIDSLLKCNGEVVERDAATKLFLVGSRETEELRIRAPAIA